MEDSFLKQGLKLLVCFQAGMAEGEGGFAGPSPHQADEAALGVFPNLLPLGDLLTFIFVLQIAASSCSRAALEFPSHLTPGPGGGSS